MAKNPLYTAKATALISLAKEVERFKEALDQAELRLDVQSAEEIALRARAIVHEADTMALPKRLIPAARAIADAAYLIDQLVSHGLGRAEASVAVFSIDKYQEVANYTQKALEALKLPALYYGADIDALETTGGLYL